MVHWDPHIGEERLVELGVTGHRLQGANLDARRAHRKDQVGNAAMLGCVRLGPDQAKDHVCLLGGAGPDLLAIDNKLAVFDVRAGLEVSEVRPGTGFGIALAPDNIAFRSEEHTSELQSLMRISYAF